MANEVSPGQLITASKINDITVGSTAPASPTTGQVWADTSTNPPTLRVRTSSGTWSGITPSVTTWALVYAATSGSAVTTLNDTNYSMATYTPTHTITLGSSRFILRLLVSWGTSGTSRAIRPGFAISLQNGYGVALLGYNSISSTAAGDGYIELVHMPITQSPYRAGGFFTMYGVTTMPVQPIIQHSVTGSFSTSSPISSINFIVNNTQSTGETVTLRSASVELFTTL